MSWTVTRIESVAIVIFVNKFMRWLLQLAHGAFDFDSIRKFTVKIKIGTIYSAANDNAQFDRFDALYFHIFKYPSEKADWKITNSALCT